jgi:hypothetical protein
MSKLTKLDTFLQSIQDYIRNGYTQYITRQVTSENELDALARKNCAIWRTELNASGRHKALRRGESTAVQISYVSRNGKAFYSVLLVKPGKDYEILSEDLPFLDANKKHSRLTIFGYEIYHDGISWTWRMNSKEINRLNKKIEDLTKKPANLHALTQDEAGTRDTKAEEIQDDLYSRPGFRGINRQIGTLISKLRGEWKRYQSSNPIKPTERTYLKYMRRVKRA